MLESSALFLTARVLDHFKSLLHCLTLRFDWLELLKFDCNALHLLLIFLKLSSIVSDAVDDPDVRVDLVEEELLSLRASRHDTVRLVQVTLQSDTVEAANSVVLVTQLASGRLVITHEDGAKHICENFFIRFVVSNQVESQFGFISGQLFDFLYGGCELNAAVNPVYWHQLFKSIEGFLAKKLGGDVRCAYDNIAQAGAGNRLKSESVLFAVVDSEQFCDSPMDIVLPHSIRQMADRVLDP